MRNLFDLLNHAAKDPRESAITVYNTNSEDGSMLTYQSLLALAKNKFIRLQQRFGSIDDKVVLLYFDNHLDGIVWFWAIVLAGGRPCICPPLIKDQEQRQHIVRHMQACLENPLIITTESLVPEFPNSENLHVVPIGSIESTNIDPSPSSLSLPGCTKSEQDLAVLMLTSGSTGNSKAVCLSHGQILSSLRGKSIHHGTTEKDVFLNWIGLDHVANLVEIHLHAMSLAAQQVHIQSSDILANPTLFLEKVALHKVTYTFAPNFFLAILVRSLGSLSETYNQDKEHPDNLTLDMAKGTNSSSFAVQGPQSSHAAFDLSSLRALISGGESNVVDTCDDLTRKLQHYGAPRSFIRPGFGMTETCAGSIYNALDCPSYDRAQGTEFCSLGECIQGIQMRILRPDGTESGVNEIGSLVVSGSVVFAGYYNDEKSTREAFTDQGWFRTGDLGLLDANGRLRLTGREKDIIVVNGVNHSFEAIEAVIEAIPEVTPSYTVAFPYRPEGSTTELLCVVYLPALPSNDLESRMRTATKISKAVVKYCGTRPSKIIALPVSLLRKSSLGKLSRSKIRQAFEDGTYAKYEIEDRTLVPQSSDIFDFKGTPTQKIVLQHVSTLFGVNASRAISSDLFDLGASSIDLLKLRARLQQSLKIEIPITHLFSHPTIRDLGQSLDALHNNKRYNPITLLQAAGTRTPLFIIHPGMGDVLIFLNLARYITERRVYGLGAPGFNGEKMFSSIPEMITAYCAAIKQTQPTGPYAIAGYLFGSIIAFEITKLLEATGDTVQFLATIDQPPHLKLRARMYDWYQTVLTISFFMGLITKDYANKSLPEMRKKSHEDVLDHILGLADPSRLDEIGMTRERLDNWANLAYQLKVIAREYDPKGMVARMHVFYTRARATTTEVQSEQQWFDDYISKWRGFARHTTFHNVAGEHTTSISPPNVFGFQKLLKDIMREDGL